jgi:hypothetical protein
MSNCDISVEETSLFKHYHTIKIKTLSDLYEVRCEVLDRYSFDNPFLPWIHTEPVTQYQDVAFISRDKKFINNQFRKILMLIKSIRDNGYKPEDYPDRKMGHITGYFLANEIEKRFYVVSGNHRVSVISAIFPESLIEVIFEKIDFMKSRDKANNGVIKESIFPTEFNLSDSNNWPGVKSGFIKRDIAIQLFNRYLER